MTVRVCWPFSRERPGAVAVGSEGSGKSVAAGKFTVVARLEAVKTNGRAILQKRAALCPLNSRHF
jgi:hypothetical protein